MKDDRKICKNCRHMAETRTKGGHARYVCDLTTAVKHDEKQKRVYPLYFCHMFKRNEND